MAYVIVKAKSLEMENITSSFISMFNLDINHVNKKKMKITDLLEDFNTNINEYIKK